ncbi:hypothetical protein [Brevundimonas sp.]|uniref:hypothetical protein n=1 Tax=Brevundimonas sp. TaxID=1871086 RepID=UPI002ABA2DF2|nr:hypothetical protein [Brevundimonas sp.]MDZ4362203.1 hypothetical protein [Brevundimonas sp.]
MSAFEYVFTFYGLLLGLAAANVATGFADMWRDRLQVAVGVCTPLIAFIVLLGVMNLWLRFWANREMDSPGPWQMIGFAGLALPYVFISRAMFPGAGGATSLETHYLEHRRIMLLALATPPIVSLVTTALTTGLAAEWSTIWVGLRVLAPIALLPFGGRTANRIGLAAILGLLVMGLFR